MDRNQLRGISEVYLGIRMVRGYRIHKPSQVQIPVRNSGINVSYATDVRQSCTLEGPHRQPRIHVGIDVRIEEILCVGSRWPGGTIGLKKKKYGSCGRGKVAEGGAGASPGLRT
jgi:hypothetical protein